jgi:SecD/SecF fusion protein
MKNARFTASIIVIAIALSFWAVSDPKRFVLGPDLSGGTTLIYAAAPQEGGGTVDMNQLVPVLKERLDPAGLANFVLRPLGSDRVEIVLPNAATEDVDEIKRQVSTAGQLEFRILAHRSKHPDMIERAEDSWPSKFIGQESFFVRYGAWIPVGSREKDDVRPIDAHEKEVTEQAEQAWKDNKKIVNDSLRWQAETNLDKVFVITNLDDAKNKLTPIKKDESGRRWVLLEWSDEEAGVNPVFHCAKTDDEGNRFVLMVKDEFNVTGEYLSAVAPSNEGGAPAVSFSFNGLGSNLFGELTGRYRPDDQDFRYQLGVILDSRLRSAPNLEERITSQGIIRGKFTDQEVQSLVKILQGGRLPFALEKQPSSQFQIGATLGQETIRRGVVSIIGSFLLVCLFMIYYYRIAGIVAVIALLLNGLFTIALMVAFKATWTLPGLAGLVLSVGMSVDANVLVSERMREE